MLPPHRRLPLIALIAFCSPLALLPSGAAWADGLPLPPAPPGLGRVDQAPPPAGVIAYVDSGATNQRGDACHATLNTNAGVRVLSGFLKVWTPLTELVDADQAAPAKDGCPAVEKSHWSGLPGTPPDGTIIAPAVHEANIAYVIKATKARTLEQSEAAYLDDRRNKNVSLMDGLGPLAEAWRQGAHQTTTITMVPEDAASHKYEDDGNNRGVAGDANPDLGKAVALIEALSVDGSTEPAKRFYKYARPYRWSSEVAVPLSLESAKSKSPVADGGFPSGHTAEGWRDGLALAYLVPERFQEMLTRATQLGENRILAGMHSPMDVMGGRVLGTAIVAYNLNKADNAALKSAAYDQAQGWLLHQTGSDSLAALIKAAHGAPTADDAYANAATNKARFEQRLTYDLPVIGPTDAPPVVPKGAEVLLETRLPYLSADQRRVVLKTTEIPSGHPLSDDAEGWGRLNLLAAADGYGAFTGDVEVTMDGAKGGFNAYDTWRNNITGPGRLTKQGSGTLALSGANRWTGGTVIAGGTLRAENDTALGGGDVRLDQGTLAVANGLKLKLGGSYGQTADGTLELGLGDGPAGLTVAGPAVIAGGTLRLVPAPGYQGKIGETIPLLTASRLSGQFARIEFPGHNVTPIYDGASLSVKILP